MRSELGSIGTPNATRVCHIDDLYRNCGVSAMLHGNQIALFYLPDEQPCVYAVDHYDPCSNAYVLAHGVVGDINSELVVASPIYKQHFSLTTGRCLEDPTKQIKVHRVLLQDQHVYLVQ